MKNAHALGVCFAMSYVEVLEYEGVFSEELEALDRLKQEQESKNGSE